MSMNIICFYTSNTNINTSIASQDSLILIQILVSMLETHRYRYQYFVFAAKVSLSDTNIIAHLRPKSNNLWANVRSWETPDLAHIRSYKKYRANFLKAIYYTEIKGWWYVVLKYYLGIWGCFWFCFLVVVWL